MAYPDDLVGKFIDNPVLNPALSAQQLPHYQNGPALGFTEHQTRQIHRTGGTSMVKATPGAVGAGQDIQAPDLRPKLARQPAFEGVPWNYDLLQYVPGLVTAMPLSTDGILTGWMSGCYLFRYIWRGTRYVAHVGTDVNSPENTRIAKQIWRDFVERQGPIDVVGCNVVRETPLDALAACQSAMLEPKVAGYFAPNGSARILTFGKHILGTEGTGVYHKLVNVGMMPMTSWTALRNLPAFN